MLTETSSKSYLTLPIYPKTAHTPFNTNSVIFGSPTIGVNKCISPDKQGKSTVKKQSRSSVREIAQTQSKNS
jgi:hypothetical protein